MSELPMSFNVAGTHYLRFKGAQTML